MSDTRPMPDARGAMYRFRGRQAEIQDREGTHGNWLVCPSTHCDRAQECRSPHECSGRGRHDQGPIEAELLGGIAVHIGMTPTPLAEVLPLMTDDWLDANASPVMVGDLRDAVETLLIRLRRIASAAGHHDPAEGCRVILEICREGT